MSLFRVWVLPCPAFDIFSLLYLRRRFSPISHLPLLEFDYSCLLLIQLLSVVLMLRCWTLFLYYLFLIFIYLTEYHTVQVSKCSCLWVIDESTLKIICTLVNRYTLPFSLFLSLSFFLSFLDFRSMPRKDQIITIASVQLWS